MHVKEPRKGHSIPSRAFSPGTSPTRDLPGGITPAVIVAVLTIVGLALRFAHLGEWNFQATEMFTLRDSVTPQFRNTRPLGYLLNYYIVKPFLPLDEFGLRLLPAIFGVLAIPVFYLVSRSLVSVRAALFGSLLVTVSHLHVMYSQLARYWSLVFLLSAIYPYALFIAVRDRNRGALVLGVVTGVLAALAHPVSLLLLGGPALLLLAHLRREHIVSVWQQPMFRWIALLFAVVIAIVAWRFIPILQAWVSMHDKNPGSGQFLVPSLQQGLKQVFYLLAFLEGLTLPVGLTAIAGIYLIWRELDKFLGMYLASIALFTVAFLTLISIRTPVSQYYLLPVVPVFFLGAAACLDYLCAVDWRLRSSWVLPVTFTVIVVCTGAPTLISEYFNGRRYDFRSMAQWLDRRITPGDAVFSDQPMVLAHYLPGTKVERLRPDTVPLRESLQTVQRSGPRGTLWIVAPARGHTFRTDLKRGGLIDWIHTNCQLRALTGKGRLDFRQQYLEMYRCPPANPP
jgi:hypothetical protein